MATLLFCWRISAAWLRADPAIAAGAILRQTEKRVKPMQYFSNRGAAPPPPPHPCGASLLISATYEKTAL